MFSRFSKDNYSRDLIKVWIEYEEDGEEYGYSTIHKSKVVRNIDDVHELYKNQIRNECQENGYTCKFTDYNIKRLKGLDKFFYILFNGEQ